MQDQIYKAMKIKSYLISSIIINKTFTRYILANFIAFMAGLIIHSLQINAKI